MVEILHVECKACGGAMGLTEVDRLLTCDYCGVRSVVEAGRYVPEYYYAPRHNQVDARRALQGALRNKMLPEGLLKNSRFHSSQLYFIPYHELSARRLGRMTFRDQPSLEEKKYGPRPSKVNTRVIIGDVQSTKPAVHLPGWGIEKSAIEIVGGESSAVLLPFDRKDVARQGKIYQAVRDSEHVLDQLDLGAHTISVEQDLEYAEVRVSRIYYPIWRFRYRYKGRMYRASVDGITGEVIALRAPQDDGQRVIWLLGTAMMVAFFLGVLFSVAIVFAKVLGWVLGIASVLLIVVAGFVALGWEQFRYPGEVVITGKDVEIVKLNQPDTLVSQRILDGLRGVFSILNKGIKGFGN
jgi:hypothetical protein